MAIQYFIPDWDDRVDPTYNFLTDEHAPGRDPYRDDCYAHEIYDTPPYDGILLSRATLDDNARKRDAIQAAGSVHRYLRLPREGEHTVMGDCGAFSYWEDDVPPYETAEVLQYYHDLGFDAGVSVDHLIFAEVEAEKERRWQITMANAEEFLRLHGRERYRFRAVGVAQGWDPASYRRAAAALVGMGYRHIAVGGLVRSRSGEILRALAAVHEVVPHDVTMHLFGVTRLELAATFASLGVTSFDSASRLRRAWMDGRRNYFLDDTDFMAIRIPEARKAAERSGADEAETRRQEQQALKTLRAYDAGQAALNETLDAAAGYARLTQGLKPHTEREYRRTLEMRPWKLCSCAICARIGVEVIIFRGNNRNRRRGFHNTWQLYERLRQLDAEPEPLPGAIQLALSL